MYISKLNIKRNIIGYTNAARAPRLQDDSGKAIVSRGFFKESGNDIFLGVTTPQVCRLARGFCLLPLTPLAVPMADR